MFEIKFSFPDCSLIFIQNIIVINNSIFVPSRRFCLVAVANQHELMRLCFPNCSQWDLEIGNLILLSNGILDLYSLHLVILHVVSQIKIAEFNFSLVLVPPPNHHRVIVRLFYWVFVGPLILNALKLSCCHALLRIQSIIISVVGEF